MITWTIKEFLDKCKAQAVPREHVAVVCPMCKTAQSLTSLMAAGEGYSLEQVEKYFGYSCIGRLTGAGPDVPGEPPGRGCNWTLGGLFRLHELEVVTEDGVKHMHFMPATPEQAKELMEAATAAKAAT